MFELEGTGGVILAAIVIACVVAPVTVKKYRTEQFLERKWSGICRRLELIAEHANGAQISSETGVYHLCDNDYHIHLGELPYDDGHKYLEKRLREMKVGHQQDNILLQQFQFFDTDLHPKGGRALWVRWRPKLAAAA